MISDWALEEVAGVELNDDRLCKRMAIMLSSLGNRPNLSIPGACGGHAEMQAAYRFFDNEKVSFENVLAPHLERTLQRMATQEVVLLPDDSSEIDLSRPEQQVQGVGELDGSRLGVLLHVMHAFTPDGTPLGTVGAQYLNRTQGVSHAPEAQKERLRKSTPIEEKESMRWLDHLRRARDVAAKLPEVQCIYLADSEGDIYELLAEPRDAGGLERAGQLHWVIRGCYDRALEGQERGEHRHLRDEVLGGPVLYKAELQIRGRCPITAIEQRPRRQARRARVAKVEVRAATVELRPPSRPDRQLPVVKVNVVLVRERRPPSGEEPVEWVLMTSLPIDTAAQVRRIVEYYCVRWNIEILFRTLKSGCRIERRRFEHVDRVARCLALYLIVAWRTLFVCRMGRGCPDADCQTIFEPSEWKAVWTAVHGTRPPKKTPRLSDVVHLIAGLGGYIQRPNSEPGPQTIWIGLQRMYDLAWAWNAFGPEARTRDA